MLTRCSVSGIAIEIGSDARRRDRLHSAGPRASADSVDEVARRAEFALHDRARQQRVVHRQHADRRGVTAVRRGSILISSSEYM